ncbi:MAG: hypothetical protein NTY66_01460 [Candidatus Vogelbacteria bacterium]|nr:hypothetical protein [Candidatus Vogelbacteria bacterium]
MKKRHRNRQKNEAVTSPRRFAWITPRTIALSLIVVVVSSWATSYLSSVKRACLKEVIPARETSFQANPTEIFDRLAVVLPEFETGNPLAPFVQNLKKQLPNLKEFLQTWLPEAKGLQIDLILQTHSYPEMIGDLRKVEEVKNSQIKVRRILEELSPDIVTTEGSANDEINGLSDVIAEQIANDSHQQKVSGEILTPLDPEQLKQALLAVQLPMDGCLQYLLAKPASKIIGGETIDLWACNGNLNNILANDDQKQPKIYYSQLNERLKPLLVDARSDLTVARIIRALQQSGKKQGAIVIGFYHRERIKRLAQVWGFKCSVYSTVEQQP